jgi:hypothetical protein
MAGSAEQIDELNSTGAVGAANLFNHQSEIINHQ